MKLLLLSPFLPSEKSYHGGGRLLFEMIEHLCGRHQVGLIAFSHDKDSPEPLDTLKHLCWTIRTVHKDIFHLERKKRLANLFSFTPSWFLHTDSEIMRSCIQETIERHSPDLVQVEFFIMSHYIDRIHHPRIILNTHEAFGRTWIHKALGKGWSPLTPYFLWDYWRLARFEKKLLDSFQSVLTFSHEDRQYLLYKNLRVSVSVWSPGVKLRSELGFQTSKRHNGSRLLFVGSFLHSPNVDGIRFFCKKILPKVVQKRTQVLLDIVGSHPPASVQALQGPHVVVHGYVEDLDAFYQKADVAVVPVRYGGGIRIKLLEALGQGIPIVTTTAGAQGIEGIDGEHLFITDSPEEFAHRIIQLLSDPELRQKMRASARELVREKYSWPHAIDRLEAVYEQVLRTRTPMTRKEIDRSHWR